MTLEPVSKSSVSQDFDEKLQLRQSVPVAVILAKQMIQKKFWREARWSLDTVLVGDEASNPNKALEKVEPKTETERFAFGEMTLVLYRDACERYWHSLIGDKPLVYVVCRRDDIESDADEVIEPAIVTLDYDEALSYVETDGTVLSAEIPAVLYQMMEKFVLQNYRPKKFKKRKRKNWSENDGSLDSGSGSSASVTSENPTGNGSNS